MYYVYFFTTLAISLFWPEDVHEILVYTDRLASTLDHISLQWIILDSIFSKTLPVGSVCQDKTCICIDIWMYVYLCVYIYIHTYAQKLLVLVWETFAFFDHWKAVCIHLHSSFAWQYVAVCPQPLQIPSQGGLTWKVLGYYILVYSTAPTQIVLMLLCVVTWLGLAGRKACSCNKRVQLSLFPTDVRVNRDTAKTICLVDLTREHSAKSAKHFSLYSLEL